MSSPWLEVPLEDYEGHMLAPEVAQLPVLADLFAQALALRRPTSVAVLGVAGGNGLDRVDPALTKRVVGFDCNSFFSKPCACATSASTALNCTVSTSPGRW